MALDKPGGMTTEEGLLWEIAQLVKQIAILGNGDVKSDGSVNFTGEETFEAGLKTDTIEEATPGAGITFTGLVAWTASSSGLQIRNPANTFSYTIVASAIAANRTLTIPLLTGNDTISTLGLAQTITAAKTFNNGTLLLRNPADTFSYTITPAAIAADRVLNLPLTTATDTLACLGLAQNFTAQTAVSGQLKAGTTNIATTSYRTTNGGSNVNPDVWFGSAASTAGFVAALFDTSNSQIVLAAANGTRHIARASLQIVSLVNTAGSESGDFAIFTQTAGAAMAEAMRITGTKLVGIGLTPTKGYLELKAGTTSLAPLVLTSGTNNSTAQPGAFEYNGTNLFFTRTGTTRENVLCVSTVTTEALVSDTTFTVNVNGTTYKVLARA